MPMKYDVIVIGSGVAGLSAATLLAQNGLNAAIVEKSPLIAPLLSRFKRENVWCDPGFHYIGGLSENSSFTKLFKYLQVFDKLEPEPMDPEGFDIINLNGNEYRIPYGLDNLQTYLCSRFPASTGAVKLFIEKIQSILAETPLFNLELGFNESSLFLNEEGSLRDYLLSINAEEALIGLLGVHSSILADSGASEIPLVFYAYLLGSYYMHTATFRKGGDSIVSAFKGRLEQLSVPVYTHCEVKSILADEHKQVKGVQLKDDRVLECNNIISTIHPQLLLSILPADKLKPIYINRLKDVENTAAAFAVFYDLESVPDIIKKANYYRISQNGTVNSITNLALMNLHQDSDPLNRKSFTAFCFCPPELQARFFELVTQDNGTGKHTRNEAYKNLKTEISNKIEAQILDIFPGLRGKLKHLASATPVTYENYTGTIKGSIYGAKQTVRQRALSSKSRLHGLYVSGQSIMPGVLGGIVSSLFATIHITGYENIWKGIKACR